MAEHHNHSTEHVSDGRLVGAILLNLGLTVAEVIGGVLSGSLSLIADAVHNFNDCGSLIIALVARRIARKEADEFRTFGYRRAEVIGALINLTALLLVSAFLIYEAIERYRHPQEIHGWTVVGVAALALIVDVATVMLLTKLGTDSVNVRAAALHNLSDAMASAAVIVVGLAIVYWKFYALDVIVTLLIAAYVVWQCWSMLKLTIRILMESAPPGIRLHEIHQALIELPGIIDAHHLHAWQIDEHQNAFEAHIVISADDLPSLESIKASAKQVLKQSFNIGHSTLELELESVAATHDNSIVPSHGRHHG